MGTPTVVPSRPHYGGRRNVGRSAVLIFKRTTDREVDLNSSPSVLAWLSIVPVSMTGCITEAVTVSAPATEFALVTAGTGHACGLTTGGVIACWSVADPRPVVVADAVPFSSTSTATFHTCGIATDGTAFCWGQNTYGQLGTLADAETCGGFPCTTIPIRVHTDLLFTTLEVGGLHTCGLDTDGFAHCWGSNSFGQLGAISDFVCFAGSTDGGLPCSPEPLPVAGGLTFTALSVGAIHACGLTASGQVYCWGSGAFGRLGNGDVETSVVPVEVAGNLAFRQISAGGAHSCGITTSEDVYCWGSNSELQLGSIANNRLQPCGRLPDRCVLEPVLVKTDLRFQTVTAAVGGHTCGVTTDGAVYCWGLNEFGELLLPNKLRSAEPVRIPVEGVFTQISGGSFNTCGITTEFAAVCWPDLSPLANWVVPADR